MKRLHAKISADIHALVATCPLCHREYIYSTVIPAGIVHRCQTPNPPDPVLLMIDVTAILEK